MFRWRHFHFCTNAFSCEGKMQILRIWHQQIKEWRCNRENVKAKGYAKWLLSLYHHTFAFTSFFYWNFLQLHGSYGYTCTMQISMMTTELGKSLNNNACIAPCLCKLAFSPISALYHHIFALSHLCHCVVFSFHFRLRLCSLTQTFYYMQ